ncbi:unnamed protein product [Polarella glacialis]|uniref:Prokaryotic-type class I peptide chain release factors domain-containing protein n=1 Tax=Polarella glacialis TaxID=89957 RepID=A0A813DVB1_POLGL|nr:unnamed protein product [Polarella glacialis]CAE8662429.1 unnamed protein product [Polarella glacialis]
MLQWLPRGPTSLRHCRLSFFLQRPHAISRGWAGAHSSSTFSSSSEVAGALTEAIAQCSLVSDVIPAQNWEPAVRICCKAMSCEAAELRALIELAKKEQDGDFAGECENQLVSVWAQGSQVLTEAVLADAPATSDCFLEIHSGEGGVDAMDWCRMLGQMYEDWSAIHGLAVERVGEVPGDIAGFRSLTLHFSGAPAFGLLSAESGVHRLIRTSPFDRKGRRHTSFVVVLVLEEDDGNHNSQSSKQLAEEIPRKELKIETMRASGAGGQSVNMSETAVRITHLPTGISAKCQRAPSQIDNKKTAMMLLCAKLRAHAASKKRQERAAHYAGRVLEASAAAEKRVRTYTMHPQEMVKDHRCGLQVSDAGLVLSGSGLHPFLECGILCSLLEELTPA